MSYSNPRRTPAARQDSDIANGLKIKTNLRKGATFHSPTTPPSSPPASSFKVPSLPRRSQTNLDDVVGAHRRKAALTISQFEQTLMAADSAGPPSRSFHDNSLPIPRVVLGHAVADSKMAQFSLPERRVLHPRRRSPRHHDSDSGLGTSLDSASEKKDVAPGVLTVNRSMVSLNGESVQSLSERSVNRIHEHTLGPLLSDRSLKAFHPIVHDCPRRIAENQIVCLRDLEKTLIFMAPVSQILKDPGVWGVTYRTLCFQERAKSVELYIDFCLTSIRCIQATVEYLPDREQTRPHERPYSQGYFIDLVEQIHQHAERMKEARVQQTAGETLGEMDVESYEPQSQPHPLTTLTNTHSRGDEVRLMGGLTKNGRPAELVRVKKNGKAFSVATGMPVEDYDDESKSPIRFKRSLSQQLEDEEEIMRSMARRKKNASPEELAPKKCKEPGCTKEFKRPCDLTKHEKTHSRPWKCPVATCKYHDYGWPTEKEMDRHVNDKHSSSPPMFECLFKPCPYKSKRESNCKQHMEKAHGWTYVRSKSNGTSKKGESKPGSSAIVTPMITNLPTPNSDHTNPVMTPVMTPPDEDLFGYDSDFPSYPTAEQFVAENGMYDQQLYAGDISLDFPPHEFSAEDLSPIDHPTPSTDAGQFNAYHDLSPEFTGQFEDIYGAHVQIPTPPNQVYAKPVGLDSLNFIPGTTQQQHISPVGQANAMLFTPTSIQDVDEGFEDYTSNYAVGGDFCLYPSDSVNAKPEELDNLFGSMSPNMALGYPQVSQDFNIDYNQPMQWAPTDMHDFHTPQ